MDFTGILNQVLNAGQQISRQRSNNTFNSNNNDTLKKIGGGAAAVGLLSMLLGKSGNKGFGQSALELGSLAAIGSMAYSAWKKYQAENNTNNQVISGQNFASPEMLSTPKNNDNSQLIIKAMIAAAAADGRIEPAESNAIMAEIGNTSPDVQAWIQQQINNPPTVQNIALEVNGDIALASQIYLASRIVCDDLDRKEIIYLHDLAKALNLDDALVEKLESQAGF